MIQIRLAKPGRRIMGCFRLLNSLREAAPAMVHGALQSREPLSLESCADVEGRKVVRVDVSTRGLLIVERGHGVFLLRRLRFVRIFLQHRQREVLRLQRHLIHWVLAQFHQLLSSLVIELEISLNALHTGLSEQPAIQLVRQSLLLAIQKINAALQGAFDSLVVLLRDDLGVC